MHELSILATLKNEGPYLLEWIAYHQLVGVDHFYLYDNESTDDSAEILTALAKLGIVTYKFWPSQPGLNKQVSAYEDFLASPQVRDTRWLAIVDGDEFIVPIEGGDLKAILKHYDGIGGVGFNWRVFGSAGEQVRGDAPVMARFARASSPDHPANRHLKSIVHPTLVRAPNVHMCEMQEGHRIVDEGGAEVDYLRKGYHNRIVSEKVRINHYFTKSREEWNAKRARGRAAVVPGDPDSIRSDSLFADMDLNDVEDRVIQRFLPQTEQRILALREAIAALG